MGNFFKKMKNLAKGKEELRIIMIGLDNAGKSSLLYKLKLGEVVATTPTVGFNVESIKIKKLSFSVWDIGGQEQIRGLWRHYFIDTVAVIFVVDSNDENRINEAKEELHKVVESPELINATILVLANKQDIPHT